MKKPISPLHQIFVGFQVLALSVVFGVPQALAVEFDLIYPIEVNVGTPQFSVGRALYLGLIVATTETVTVTDLENAACSAVIDDPLVTVTCRAVVNPQWGPLDPKEALGQVSGPMAPYLTLLYADESLVANVPGVYIDFDYRSEPGHDGDATLDYTLSIGDHQVAFTTLVHFVGDLPSNEIVVVGRLSADKQPQSVSIDINPGSDPNCFNINGHGVIPVAVLGDEDFDVNQIDVTTLSLAGLKVRVRSNKGPLCSIEYSNDDAYPDLVCHFEDDPSSWNTANDIATLTGSLLDGTPFEGTDSICVVP